MSKKEITVTTIMYRGDECGNPYSYEDTTLLSFDEWLKKHNKDRKEEGNLEEYDGDFECFETTFTV
tara:strand:- start:5111 stop:5308 length:198 start_codon:yes stop_codon:yes gene_type:complete